MAKDRMGVLDEPEDLGRIRRIVLRALGREQSALTTVLLVEHLIERMRAAGTP